MKHLRSLSLIALVAVLGLAIVGCSDDVNAPTDDPIGTDDFDAIDFDDPTGGLTATDEEIAFGDAFLLQEVARENEELYDDVIAIAVPIRDRRGRFYSSLAVQAPVSRLTAFDRDKVLPLLREAARDLARLTEN